MQILKEKQGSPCKFSREKMHDLPPRPLVETGLATRYRDLPCGISRKNRIYPANTHGKTGFTMQGKTRFAKQILTEQVAYRHVKQDLPCVAGLQCRILGENRVYHADTYGKEGLPCESSRDK
jgi:hypothetical protein